MHDCFSYDLKPRPIICWNCYETKFVLFMWYKQVSFTKLFILGNICVRNKLLHCLQIYYHCGVGNPIILSWNVIKLFNWLQVCIICSQWCEAGVCHYSRKAPSGNGWYFSKLFKLKWHIILSIHSVNIYLAMCKSFVPEHCSSITGNDGRIICCVDFLYNTYDHMDLRS